MHKWADTWYVYLNLYLYLNAYYLTGPLAPDSLAQSGSLPIPGLQQRIRAELNRARASGTAGPTMGGAEESAASEAEIEGNDEERRAAAEPVTKEDDWAGAMCMIIYGYVYTRIYMYSSTHMYASCTGGFPWNRNPTLYILCPCVHVLNQCRCWDPSGALVKLRGAWAEHSVRSFAPFWLIATDKALCPLTHFNIK